MTDPGPDTELEVFLTHHGATEGILRTYVAPESVLVLVPAGEPVPAPPPVRPSWRRVVRIWLVVFILLVVGVTAVHAWEGDIDPGGVAGLALSLSLGYALAIGAATLFLHRRHR